MLHIRAASLLSCPFASLSYPFPSLVSGSPKISNAPESFEMKTKQPFGLLFWLSSASSALALIVRSNSFPSSAAASAHCASLLSCRADGQPLAPVVPRPYFSRGAWHDWTRLDIIRQLILKLCYDFKSLHGTKFCTTKIAILRL